MIKSICSCRVCCMGQQGCTRCLCQYQDHELPAF
nr:MAG TPA: Methylamine utilization protein MauG [Caudoviricetes sp.]